MTFRKLDPTPGRRVDEVSVGIAKHASRAKRVRITFHKGLCEKMGWDDTSLVEVMVGEGTDLGWVRFKPATVKGFRLRRAVRGDRLVVMIPAAKADPDYWRAGAVEYGIAENALTIRLPWVQKLRAVG
jgi:hypothetical protein